MKVVLQVVNSPFDEKQVHQLNEILTTLTKEQKIWLTGYLSGSISTLVIEPSTEPNKVFAIDENDKNKEVTILFGSQTGNAEYLAKKFGNQLESLNFRVNVLSMSDFKSNALKKIEHLFIITSTHGEGDPPDNAITFHTFLHGKRAPKLHHLKYSVLSLGDRSYEFFCKTGKDFDIQLEKLGATRIVERADCDLDFEDDAEKWFNAVKEKLVDAPARERVIESLVTQNKGTEYNRKNPFKAEIIEKINLNGQGSNKETIHLELSLEDSGIQFEPGDSLSIIPINNEDLVQELIQQLGFDGETVVEVNHQTVTLRHALTHLLEITVLTKPLLENISNYTKNDILPVLLSDRESLKEFIYGRDLLDVVRKFGPFDWDAQSFVENLRSLPARQYSIASSLAAYPEEAHLTIGVVRYEIDERKRLGVCSTYISDKLEVGDYVQVYVQKNPNFKLPDDNTPIIMVGPGTGVAPFRAFMQEREERGATGESWLFFGDQHFVTDFLYQREWLSYLKNGVLTKLDVAFSRDHDEKVYVQHKMQKNAKELFEWLERGAVLYVCGDQQMAKDVHNTLIDIIAQQGQKTEEEAEEYLNQLRSEKRYQRDVY